MSKKRKVKKLKKVVSYEILARYFGVSEDVVRHWVCRKKFNPYDFEDLLRFCMEKEVDIFDCRGKSIVSEP